MINFLSLKIPFGFRRFEFVPQCWLCSPGGFQRFPVQITNSSEVTEESYTDTKSL